MQAGLITADAHEPIFLPQVCDYYSGMEVLVYGNDERMVVSTRFDNLGKGVSGTAVQCMNLMIGADEDKGLNL